MGPATEKIRLATFDCYGTLIDWEGGGAAFLYQLARRHEPVPPPARELCDRWEALQFERLQADGFGFKYDIAPAQQLGYAVGLGKPPGAGARGCASRLRVERPLAAGWTGLAGLGQRAGLG